MPSKPVGKRSRQQEWQDKMLKAGRCIVCGKKRTRHAHRCEKCQLKVRKAQGGGTWKPGSRGRIPESVLNAHAA